MNRLRIVGLGCAMVTLLTGCDYMPTWMGGKKEDIVRLPGERQEALPLPAGMQPDPAIAAMTVSLPAPVENSQWEQHTGMIPAASGNLAIKGTLEHQDSASAGDGEAFEHTLIPRPVLGEGLVFAMDAEGKISAHDAAAIDNKRWVSEGVSEEDIDEVSGGGLAYEQGKLYAVSGRGVVVAMEAATGKVLWRKSGYAPFRSAPKVAGGKLYAITLDSQLFALDTASGEPLWSHRGINETAGIMNSVSPTVAGDTVIVPYASGELYALAAADGHALWNNSLSLSQRTEASGVFAGIGGDPVVDGEVVFAVSSGGMLAVYGMPFGQRLWEYPVSSINTPWVAGDYLFLLTADNTLVALVKYDGRVRWSTKLPSFEDEEDRRRPIFWRGPVMVDGKLAVVGARGEMKLISAADGSVVSTVSIPDDVYTAPIVAGGRMYLINKDARLTSLQ